MAFNDLPIKALKRKIDEVKRFLSISLSISNAHTVDFYTRDVWSTFMCVSPEEVLHSISSTDDRMGAIEGKMDSVWKKINRFIVMQFLKNIAIIFQSRKISCGLIMTLRNIRNCSEL